MTKIVKIKNGLKQKKWFDSEAEIKKQQKIIAYNEWKNNGKVQNDWTQYVNVRIEYTKLIKDKKS